jgi:cytochrome c oxidase subunit 4
MTEDAQARAHAGDLHGDEAHHIVPMSVYYRVFAALMVLLIITLAAAAVDLSTVWGPLNIIIAMTIAVVKAVLVVLYFMHVRYSSRLTWFFAGAAFIWLAIMFSITLADYFSREMITGLGMGTVPGGPGI